jgi:uncharacterized membrane protein (UPF0127 family)
MMSRTVRVVNTTRQAVLAERARVADRPWSRLKGLLGRSHLEPGEGLVIRPCQGVHTWFMAFPIDVLHVDAEGTVERVVSEMAPNRMGPVVWKARYVVELPAGAARASGTVAGDRLALS